MSEYAPVNASPYSGFDLTSVEKTADYELSENMTFEKLRVISRKFIKNNFIAAGAQQAYLTSIVGGSITIDIDSKSDALRVDAEKIWDEVKSYFDVSDFSEMLISEMFAAGDCLVNIYLDKNAKTKLKTRVEVIEASRVQTPPKHSKSPFVKLGVQYTKDLKKVVGYWVLQPKKDTKSTGIYHKYGDKDYKFYSRVRQSGSVTRVVTELVKAPLNLRPGQSRQYPILTPIMELMNYKNQYLEAVLIGARVAACFSGFVTTNNPAMARKALSDDDPNVRTKGGKLTKLQPGTLSYLRPNETITFASPNKPADNFDTFLLRLAKYMSMYLRMPYEIFFLDLSSVNYSSWRGGSLEVMRNIARWRRVITRVLNIIIDTYFMEAKYRKLLRGSEKSVRAKIRFPHYKSLDEEKTARANKVSLTNGTTSVVRICDENGVDFSELQEELDNEMRLRIDREARELKLKKEYSEKFGIVFPEDQIQDRDTSNQRREGESEDSNLDEEDKKERRKEDGNW